MSSYIVKKSGFNGDKEKGHFNLIEYELKRKIINKTSYFYKKCLDIH